MQIILTLLWRLTTLEKFDKDVLTQLSLSEQKQQWMQMHQKLQMDHVFLIGNSKAESTLLNKTIVELREEIASQTTTIEEMAKEQMELYIKIKHLTLELENIKKHDKPAPKKRKKTNG